MGGIPSGHCPFTSEIKNKLKNRVKRRDITRNEAVEKRDRDPRDFEKRNKPPRPGLDGNCCEFVCTVSAVTEITFLKKFDPDTNGKVSGFNKTT